MTKEQLIDKLTSRKFWLAVAAFLSSLAVGIGGLTTAKPWLAGAGAVCGVLAAAIYVGAEAYVDGQAVKAQAMEDYKIGGSE